MGGRWNPIEFQFFCFLVLIIGLQIQSSWSLNSEGNLRFLGSHSFFILKFAIHWCSQFDYPEMQDSICWNSGLQWSMILIEPLQIGILMTKIPACGMAFIVSTVKCECCKFLLRYPAKGEKQILLLWWNVNLLLTFIIIGVSFNSECFHVFQLEGISAAFL